MNLLSAYIGKRILEVGCGVGNLTVHLQRMGRLSCVDVSEVYLRHMIIDFPDVHFYNYDVASERFRTLKTESFDTVACINVLEHIDDDRAALTNMFEILQPAGRLLLYVPAMPGLYNRLDRNLDHFRRYGRRQLGEQLRETGFEVEKLVYSNLIGTLGWFLNGSLQRRRQLSIWQTLLFDRFVPVIERLERVIRPPFGMSLLAVARKPREV